MSRAPNTAPLAAVSNIILYKNFHLTLLHLLTLKGLLLMQKRKEISLRATFC